MFKLTNLNMTTLARMGDQPVPRWERFFLQLGNAKACAEQEYGQPIKWKLTKGSNFSSPDLLHTMYVITEIHTED